MIRLYEYKWALEDIANAQKIIEEKTLIIKEYENQFIRPEIEIELKPIISIRLNNALNSKKYTRKYEPRNFEYMSDIHKFIQDFGLDYFLKIPNFGIKCLNEIKELVEKYPYIENRK